MRESISILLVEDDLDLRELLTIAARKRDYNIITAANGKIARDKIGEGLTPDLIILDINMPQMDGFQFCKWLRLDFPLIPVIFLSARTEEFDKLIALEIGGDDYLTKPFSVTELFARISVCLRRVKYYQNNKKPENNLILGDVELNRDSWSCLYRTNSITLTITEFRILIKLMENPGVVFNRDKLIQTAFPDDLYNSGRSMDIHISRIRKKFMEINPDFTAIETIYKVGYRWRE